MDPRVEAPATDVLAAEEFGVPARDPAFHLRSEPASDVLAAEEFGVPAPDAVLRVQVGPPTDVLAAEEFGVPAPDPALHHETLSLPEDLVGAEARDVLVAEDFAMPAPDEARVLPHAVIRRGLPSLRVLALTLPVVSAGFYVTRRRRRQQAQGRLTRVRRLLLRR